MNRILCLLAAGALLAGCASTSTTSSSGSSPRASAKARAAQLREGMTRNQVERLLGAPSEVDHDDGYSRGHGYIPYYGWHGRSGGREEIKWEYKNIDVEVTFRRDHNGVWVVKEWDR